MNERMKEWKNEWMKEWMNERMNEWKNERMNEWKNERMKERMNELASNKNGVKFLSEELKGSERLKMKNTHSDFLNFFLEGWGEVAADQSKWKKFKLFISVVVRFLLFCFVFFFYEINESN